MMEWVLSIILSNTLNWVVSEDASEENFTVLGTIWSNKTITSTKTSTITIKFISAKLGVSDSVGKMPYNYPIKDLE